MNLFAMSEALRLTYEALGYRVEDDGAIIRQSDGWHLFRECQCAGCESIRDDARQDQEEAIP